MEFEDCIRHRERVLGLEKILTDDEQIPHSMLYELHNALLKLDAIVKYRKEIERLDETAFGSDNGGLLACYFMGLEDEPEILSQLIQRSDNQINYLRDKNLFIPPEKILKREAADKEYKEACDALDKEFPEYCTKHDKLNMDYKKKCANIEAGIEEEVLPSEGAPKPAAPGIVGSTI